MVTSRWTAAPAQTAARRRGAVLERAILDAALEQLSTVGWNGLTMEGVAAGAQTGKAAVYRRWPSKEDLVADALRAGLPQLRRGPDLRERPRGPARAVPCGRGTRCSPGPVSRCARCFTNAITAQAERFHAVIFEGVVEPTDQAASGGRQPWNRAGRGASRRGERLRLRCHPGDDDVPLQDVRQRMDGRGDRGDDRPGDGAAAPLGAERAAWQPGRERPVGASRRHGGRADRGVAAVPGGVRLGAMPYEPPTHTVERSLRATTGAKIIAGVDEVGRGAWAGPVTVCAAITGLRRPPAGLTDSKLLTPKRRAELAAALLESWVTVYALGHASPEEIDDLGMTAALRLAAVRALEACRSAPTRSSSTASTTTSARPGRSVR